ncbi:hypothetical protein [Trinickia fusca]|uniref:Uncharacterized protein n=1 Tax=Trinickia fusca TaxID=2419777 RepID=A0A494X1V1_9BURK|nr:hypothetical protein [Trinickia fusca]RKP44332.1 hypothetical protein D7S89_22650 [Trinickia fusca]
MHIERFLRESRVYLFAPLAATRTYLTSDTELTLHVPADASRVSRTDRAASRGMIEAERAPAP